MKKNRPGLSRLRRFFSDPSGSAAIIVAVGLFAFLGFAALALDIGHLIMVKNELQKAADAGALAGARGLWPVSLPVTTANPPRIPNCTTAQTWATNAITSNQVANTSLTSADATIQVGKWNFSTKQFTEGSSSDANAVRVTIQKTGIAMFFARIFGVNTKDLQATATAEMDFAQEVGWGTLPIVLNKDFTNAGENVTISMTPDTQDNGGWFVDPPDTANAKTFRDYIVNDSCPPLYVGEIINLQNGADTSVLSCLKDELARRECGYWDVFLPVVDTTQYNQQTPIISFVPFRITSVFDTGSDKSVHGTVLGMAVMENALPGGPNTGDLTPPRLVN